MPYSIQIGTLPRGAQGIALPGRIIYETGQTVTLEDDDYSQLDSYLFTSGILILLGQVDEFTTVSPTFTGIPTAPTATLLTNSTQIATTGYADAADVVVLSTAESFASTAAALAMRALNPTAVLSSPYTAAVNDLTKFDISGGSISQSLPNAPVDKSLYAAKIVKTAGTNTLTLTCQGSDVINMTTGSTSYTLKLLNQSVILQYEHATGIWDVITDDLPLGQLTPAQLGAFPLQGLPRPRSESPPPSSPHPTPHGPYRLERRCWRSPSWVVAAEVAAVVQPVPALAAMVATAGLDTPSSG
jgi:hypothetical protein